MTTMKTFALRAPHGPVEAALTQVPLIDPDEMLVRVRAVGVGIHDSYFLPAGISYPFPIGIEASGVVEQVGSAVAGHQQGDRIAFVSAGQKKGGTWAEYVVVRGDSMIVSIPAEMSFEQAAAVPVAGGTALRSIAALPPLPEGSSVFVAGASGAIGTFVVQLARARGWLVAGSASAANHDYVHALGATKTVDYHDATWVEEVRAWAPHGVDAAFAVQPNTTSQSLEVVKDGGTALTISGDQVESTRGIRVDLPPHDMDVRDELAVLMQQIAAGEVHLEIEAVYPFDAAVEALAKVQTRHARGKVVLSL